MENLLSGTNFSIILLVIGIVILAIVRRLLKFQTSYVFIGIVGLLIGLIIGNLLANPLSQLPSPWGKWLPLVVTIVISVAILDFFLSQASGFANFFKTLFSFMGRKEEGPILGKPEIILDTSVLIDGRIEEISETGFLLGKLIIPRFILDELQKVADSEDPLKRARGRRGLEVLNRLQKSPHSETEILETDFKDKQTDRKLIKLAQRRKASLLTCDFNLNRVAEIQGVSVLNINELAQALKPILLPGESLTVKIITEGKEKGQGVGYLPDGTMIVVEEGGKFVGQELECQVERIYQTVAGKMIFVRPKNKNNQLT